MEEKREKLKENRREADDKTETASSIERVKGLYGSGIKAATHALRDGHEADGDERGDANHVAAVPARSGRP